jgi:3-oxoacyl-[acyl-carrier-protein] synthase III
LPNAYISGTGFFVPPRVVTNNDLVTEYGIDTSDEWIFQRSGIRERHYAAEGVACSDLALPAAQAAIESAKIKKEDLDMIIVATLSPDQHFPGTGVTVQRKLGLCDGENAKFVPALDVRNQCSGFLYGLATATSMVQSGGAKHVLMIGSEVHSAGLDFTTRGRTVTSLFGDGAGAVIVSATEENRGVRYWKLGADGRFADKLEARIFDISKRPYAKLDSNGVGQIPPEIMWPSMDGRTVFRHAIERMEEIILLALKEQNLGPNDIDLYFFHQANLRINQMVQAKLEVSEDKFLNNIERYGNTTAATIPILLSEAVASGRLKPGMKIALVAFGSGFTWGCIIIDW